MRAITKFSAAELDKKFEDLAKPGTVFGEPYHEGDFTIIPASQIKVRPNQLDARPIGFILIGPKGVRLKRFNSPAMRLGTLALIVAIIFWSGMLLNPPWKPETNLLEQVRGLIKTIREPVQPA